MTIHQVHQALETQLNLLINGLENGEDSRVYEIPLTSAVIFAESRTKLCIAIKIPTCPPVYWHPVTKFLILAPGKVRMARLNLFCDSQSQTAGTSYLCE